MKIKTKHTKNPKKCEGCNFEVPVLFKLDGWDKGDWLCGFCFAEDLSQGKYFIETKDYAEAFSKTMEHFDYLAEESKHDINKKLKRLGL